MNSGMPTESQLAAMRQIEPPEKDVLIVAIDLLSELTEALGEMIDPLVANSKLMQLLYFCANVSPWLFRICLSMVFRTQTSKFVKVLLHCWEIWLNLVFIMSNL